MSVQMTVAFLQAVPAMVPSTPPELSPEIPLCTRYMDFVCKNRQQCLSHSMVCDGDIQCEDGSDEDANYAGCGERGVVHLKALCAGRAGEWRPQVWGGYHKAAVSPKQWSCCAFRRP